MPIMMATRIVPITSKIRVVAGASAVFMSGELIDSVRELARRVERLESFISKLDPQELIRLRSQHHGPVHTNQTMTKEAQIKRKAAATIRH
jgi:hypothetical protein